MRPFNFLEGGGSLIGTLVKLPEFICVEKMVTYMLSKLIKSYSWKVLSYCYLPSKTLFVRAKLNILSGIC